MAVSPALPRIRRRGRPLSWIALALLVLGALDPMEGSVVIAAGAVLAACAGVLTGSRHRGLLLPGAVLVSVGVAALWGLSALGGIGGTTGRSLWWALLLVPYPIGWIVVLTGTFKLVGEFRRDG
jgi:hypothetical protein